MFMTAEVEIRNRSISENAMMMHIHTCHGQNLGFALAISGHGQSILIQCGAPVYDNVQLVSSSNNYGS